MIFVGAPLVGALKRGTHGPVPGRWPGLRCHAPLGLEVLSDELLPVLHQALQFIGDHVINHQVNVFHLHHFVVGHDDVDLGHARCLAALESTVANRGRTDFLGFFESEQDVLGVAAAGDAEHDVAGLHPVDDLLAEDIVKSHVVADAGDKRHAVVEACGAEAQVVETTTAFLSSELTVCLARSLIMWEAVLQWPPFPMVKMLPPA